jgi:putative phosphoesterase
MKENMSAIGGSAYGGKIAIISDIHNNEVNLKKVLNYCASNEIEKIICCGDLASMEMLDLLNDNFVGEIFFTFGNMDNDFLKDKFFGKLDSSTTLGMTSYKNTKIFKDFGEAIIDNKKIAFVHFPEMAKKLCATGKYKFVFYGHTHKPFEEIINDCEMLNPGNVAGDGFLPTFAVWNTEDDKFELVRIHDLK